MRKSNLWTLLLIIGAIVICGGYDSLEAAATITPKVAVSYQPPGSEFWVDVQIGTSTSPVSDLFGVSFRLKYTNTSIVDTSPTDIIRGEILGTNTLLFKMVDDPNGVVSIAHSRKPECSGTSSGYGTIARIRMKLSDNASAGSRTTLTITDIEARDSQGNLIPLISSSITITVVLPPSEGVLLAPAQGLVTTNRQPLFRFGTCTTGYTYGYTYHLMVDNNPDFSSPEIDVSSSSNEYTPAGSLTEGIYYCRVSGINPQGVCGKWSEVRSFGISDIAIKPVVTSPQDQGSEFWVDINIGSSTSQVSDLFGLSLEITCSDPNMLSLVSSDSITTGPFWGTAATLFITNTETPGTVSAGMSQKTGSGTTGYGTVVRVKFRLSQDATPGRMFSFGMSQCKAYNSQGQIIPLIAMAATFTVQGQMEVWPGDTNNDGIVDERDIYPIAYYWNTTGQQRQNASLQWKAQPMKAWSLLKATYADTDGNGVVNADDVTAVGLNWLKTHPVATRTLSAPLLTMDVMDHARYVEIYRAMYRVLEATVETEGVSELKHELCQAIDAGIHQAVPTATLLGQSYPNPFNPEVWIPFTLSEPAQVIIRIYNISGQLIKTLDLGARDAGNYITKDRAGHWDGHNENGDEAASGVYFYQLQAGGVVETRQMVVLK